MERKLDKEQHEHPIALVDGGGECSSSSSLLQQLLGPIQQSIFQRDYFQQCAVHISAGGGSGDDVATSRYAALAALHLHELDPLWLLQETASENLFVWLQEDATTNRRIHSIEVNDAATAHRLHTTGGHSTYCRAPPAIEHTLVQALLQDTGMMMCSDNTTTSSLARGEVELFLSQRAGAVTDWHFDFQENFTLQLSGTKQWRLRRHNKTNTNDAAAAASKMMILRHPLRACTPHYQSPATVESQLLAARLADPDFVFAPPVSSNDKEDDEIVVTLHPGDFLYFPAGLWHRVQVIDPGVSLNISLMATHTVASLTCQALQHWLLRRPEWRQCVLPAQRQLHDLLEGQLPQLVQTFVDAYGADAVLPPALRTASVLHQDKEEQEEVDERMEEDDDDDDDETEEVIDVSKFMAPLDGFSRMKTAAQWAAAVEQYRLVINPLACLLKQREEVEQYYAADDEVDTKTTSQDGTEVLVLNVSYAGNECHESLLRVCLRAPAGAYDEVTRTGVPLWNDDDGPTAAAAATQRTIRRHAQLVDCFIHFGYLLRKPRKS